MLVACRAEKWDSGNRAGLLCGLELGEVRARVGKACPLEQATLTVAFQLQDVSNRQKRWITWKSVDAATCPLKA
jgi:hypothetical protein